MGATVAKARRSIEVQTLDLKMAKASIAVQSPENTGDPSDALDVVSLVTATLIEIGMSDKEACYFMGFDQSQFSRVKRGEARLPIDALWRLPDRFWPAFRDKLEAAKGLSTNHEKKIAAARIAELVRLLVEHVA